MKVTLNWLKQYVDFNWSPGELTERLTMLGLEVEGVQKISGAFDGIVVAQILTRDPVPGSDKLSVCKVNDGKGERTIICGAQNHKPGDKVPLILPNFALPLKAGDKEPFVIKERKVFGITSQGMMCSPQELGLPDQVNGLLILPTDAKVGQPFDEYLGRAGGDVIYDLEITPNRPDLNSVIGIAREIAAVTGNPLKIPAIVFLNTDSEPIGDMVSVRNDEAELCPRYTVRIVRQVKVGPSPEWLQSILEKVGIRSINNIVDITNYVMLESGQPLHAFDYQLLKVGRASSLSAGGQHARPTIIIRRAIEGEKFTTLDGKERTLTNQMLLIADETQAVALAGLMGGKNSEINESTTQVLIESAYFKPQNIRATSKKLELRTDASYRFERGGDIGICDWASRRAAQLICDLTNGQLLGHAIDNFPNEIPSKEITLHFSKSKDLLGIGISHAEQIGYLTKLGLNIVKQEPGECRFKIPSWRVDLKREVDLIEEVGRLYGIERIPSTPPRGALGANSFDPVYDQLGEARRILTGLGLNEAQGQTLVAKEECRIKHDEIVALANPLSSEMDVLRPSLLPGLIHSLRHNVSRKNDDVALFEIGRVFKVAQASTPVSSTSKDSQAGSPRHIEERSVAIAITGQRALPFWAGGERDARFDAYDLKGLVEDFLQQFGLRGVVFDRRAESTSLFLESAAVTLNGKVLLGELGQLLPALAKKYDLRDAVFLAEFNLDSLLSKRNPAKSFKALPQFPSSRRDAAMLVPEAITHDAVLQAVKQAKPANLESVELFDVFRGKGVPEHQKSMAYAFTYRAPDKTLTDADVNAAHEKILASLQQQLSATLR
jgi:phenylalanyl-tRNA synthetase beta chain